MKQIQSLHMWINALQTWYYPLIIIHTKENMAHRLQILLYESSEFYCIWTKEGILLRYADTWYHIVFILNTNRESARSQALQRKANYSIEIEKVFRGITFTLCNPSMKTICHVVSMMDINKAIIGIFNKIKLKKIKRDGII